MQTLLFVLLVPGLVLLGLLMATFLVVRISVRSFGMHAKLFVHWIHAVHMCTWPAACLCVLVWEVGSKPKPVQGVHICHTCRGLLTGAGLGIVGKGEGGQGGREGYVYLQVG